MSFRSFLKTPDFRKTIFRIAFVYAACLGLAWWFLNWYTDHGEFITVPEVRGMKLDEAIQALEGRELECLVIDSIYDRKAEPGTIMDQNPVAESQVKDGRQVFLTIYSMSAPMEKLGVKEGDFAAVAMIKLRNKGLEFDTLYEDNNTFPGSIIRVTYKGRRTKPDDLIPKGERVKLVIGRAVRTKVMIRDFTGWTCPEVERYLDTLNLICNCQFGPDINIPSAQDSATFRVCSQNPQEDLFGVSPGRIVDLWLYNGPCPSDTTDFN